MAAQPITSAGDLAVSSSISAASSTEPLRQDQVYQPGNDDVASRDAIDASHDQHQLIAHRITLHISGTRPVTWDFPFPPDTAQMVFTFGTDHVRVQRVASRKQPARVHAHQRESPLSSTDAVPVASTSMEHETAEKDKERKRKASSSTEHTTSKTCAYHPNSHTHTTSECHSKGTSAKKSKSSSQLSLPAPSTRVHSSSNTSMASGASDTTSSLSSRHNFPMVTCYKCQAMGHYASQCPHRQEPHQHVHGVSRSRNEGETDIQTTSSASNSPTRSQ